MTELDITVGMHASDDGLTRYYNQWEGNHGGEHLPFAGQTAFMNIAHTQGRGIFDTVASLIGHGLLSRCSSATSGSTRSTRRTRAA